jgi:very-short-patch-repair endonuclease
VEPGSERGLGRAGAGCRPGCAVAGRSAAQATARREPRLCGPALADRDPRPTHPGTPGVHRPRAQYPAERRGRIHRTVLTEYDVTETQGLRITKAPRTLADLLRTGPRNDALVAVESALGHRRVNGVRRPPLTTRATLSSALEPNLRGAVRARHWLSLADPRAGSPAETLARLHMLDAGLRPEPQAEVRIPDGRRRYLDFLFREAGLAVEIEGYAYHGTREAHRRDVARFNEVLRCREVRGLLRFSAEDVFQRPAWMIGEIRAGLGGAAGARGVVR